MAKRSFKSAGWTPVGVADTTNFTDNGYMALQGGSGTQLTKIVEVYLGGLATASAPAPLVLSRDSTIGVTLTALAAPNSDAPFHPATAALAAPVKPFVASTTKPQRDTAAGLIDLAFNTFGGAFRWVAATDEEIQMLGNTASFGELSISCYTGGSPGLMASHIVYETV